MKTITKTKQSFSTGQSVACYFSEVLMFGEVISVDGDKVTVTIETNHYPKHGPREIRLILVEYVRRNSDGRFVTEASLSERMPSGMVVPTSDIGETNNWRYRPSIIEKLKRKFSK